MADRARALSAAAQAGAEALGGLDPDTTRERAEIVAALATEAGGGFGLPAPADAHRKAVAGFLRGFAGSGPKLTLEKPA